MKEKIYNLFLFIENKLINEIGVVQHEISGDDKAKIEYLQNNVQKDFVNCRKHPIPKKFQLHNHDTNEIHEGILRYEKYIELYELGLSNTLFYEIYDYYAAPEQPMTCITVCKNGKIEIDKGVVKIKNNPITYEKIHMYSAPHYLKKYIDEEGFHINKLINDDFFMAIKELLNKNYYISSMKLLLSAIDSFAYIEFGDKSRNFINWLNEFVNLDEIKVTSEEIWEFRNSIIHMTNYDSRKVMQGKVSRIIIQIGNIFDDIANETYDGKFLNIHKFYFTISKAVENWLNSIFKNNRIEEFVKRYDQIVSESRINKIIIE